MYIKSKTLINFNICYWQGLYIKSFFTVKTAEHSTLHLQLYRPLHIRDGLTVHPAPCIKSRKQLQLVTYWLVNFWNRCLTDTWLLLDQEVWAQGWANNPTLEKFFEPSSTRRSIYLIL